MDPVNRRFVWRHIDAIKADRVVLLTTHAMEEADLLADTVAIMCQGDIGAIGSPLELKTAHGSALRFNILVDPEEVQATVKDIEEQFVDGDKFVDVAFGKAGNLNVNVHKVKKGDEDDGVDVDILTEFVTWLESDTRVAEYGFSNSSLEEVFLSVTKGRVNEANLNPSTNRGCCACCCGPVCPVSSCPICRSW